MKRVSGIRNGAAKGRNFYSYERFLSRCIPWALACYGLLQSLDRCEWKGLEICSFEHVRDDICPKLKRSRESLLRAWDALQKLRKVIEVFALEPLRRPSARSFSEEGGAERGASACGYLPGSSPGFLIRRS